MPPGERAAAMRGQKDFLAEPGVKRTDILRREEVNRKPTKVGAKTEWRRTCPQISGIGPGSQKFLTQLSGKHKVSADPPNLNGPTEAASFCLKLSGLIQRSSEKCANAPTFPDEAYRGSAVRISVMSIHPSFSLVFLEITDTPTQGESTCCV